MTDPEKAYIAGIIDGEGSISLIKQSENQHPSPTISVASTDLELLEWLKNTVGKGTLISKKNYNKIKHKDSYAFTLTKNAAIDLLKDISKYLVINKKKARAEHIIKYYKAVTVRNGKYTTEQLRVKNQFYVEFMNL